MACFFLLCVLRFGSLSAQEVGDTLRTERMPMFYASHCQALTDYPQQKSCADRAMLEFIYGQLKYPRKARRRKVEGMVVVSFIVEQDGRLTSEQIVRDLGAGTGEEVLRVVRLMEAERPWIPGIQDGKSVRVRFNLPIKFALN